MEEYIFNLFFNYLYSNPVNNFYLGSLQSFSNDFLFGLAVYAPIAGVVMILMFMAMGKLYEKASKNGGLIFVPIYNQVVLLQIIKKPIWLVVFMFVPYLNFILYFVISYYIAKTFGKDTAFTIGLIVFPFIFYPILAFGKSVYSLPISSTNQNVTTPTINPSL